MGINFNKKHQSNNINQLQNNDVLLEQVKKYICEIYINKKIKGIGFFCYIPFPDKYHLLPSLITNNHLINKKNKDINIDILLGNKETKKLDINDNRKIYTSVKFDTTIIEIKPNKDKIKYFLELDENIDKQNSNEIYAERTIYTVDYSNFRNSKKASISFGTLKKISEINKYEIYHLCSANTRLSGSPIILSNNKVIGIQKEISSNFYDFNKGIFLKYPINEFINKGKKLNEILITLKIDEIDINKNIYFLNNIDDTKHNNKKIKNELCELNNKNVELYINNKKNKFQKFFRPKKSGIYQIKLKLNIYIQNCYKMFYNCSNIISIDLSFFDSSKVIDTDHMFSRCNNLLYVNLSNFETNKVKNMNYMFSHCSNLINIDLSSFNTENVSNISYMFYNCCNLSDLDLSNFNTKNIIDMSFTFYNCKNLENINISNFNTKNVIDMSYMFSRCKKLKKINLINFNTEKVSNMSHMFSHCNSLINIDLSMFDTENVIDISSMFAFCHNLVNIDLSNFDTKNIKYMNDMFLNCYSLIDVNFPLFNIKNIRKMSYIFYNCLNLTKINKEFLEYTISPVNNIFVGCFNLLKDE